MSHSVIIELLNELRQKAEELSYPSEGSEIERDLAFDKCLGEVDLLVYKLRTECFHPVKRAVKRQRYNSEDELNGWLEELEREMNNVQSQQA